MNQHLKENERELIKQVSYFKKRAEKIILEGKSAEDHLPLIESCEKLVDTIQLHAAKRAEILLQRETLKNIVKDNAVCPKCYKNTHLKPAGIDTGDNGWKCNKYRCRKCNIEFVWAKPNNPWDLVPYLERMIANIETKLSEEGVEESQKEESTKMIEQIQLSLSKLKPVIEASDLDYAEMEAREADMSRIVNEFKMHLQIERIKLDAQDN
ncbi:MAG TPA: hypothetical protein VGC65_01280 [Bacteroidia bacterium]|jgi:hypothetical protein